MAREARDGGTTRSRRGFHPLGALGAVALGMALGLSVFIVPAAAGASSPIRPAAALATAPTPAVAPPAVPPVTTTTITPPTTAKAAPTPTTAAPTSTTAVRRPVPSVPRPSVTTAATASPATAPTASKQAAAALPAAPKVGPFTFLTLDHGRPVRYDPCQPIHYTANLALAPANGLADLQEAVRRVSVATGLTFVYDGATTEIPTSHREMHGDNRLPSGWPPVVVAWALPSDTDLFTSGSVGEGGSTWSGFPDHEVYVTGLVVIDASQNAKLSAGFGGHSLGAVLMHELGHVVGLDHVQDTSQMMYPTVTGKTAAWGTGDLAGLRQLGAEAGCFSG